MKMVKVIVMRIVLNANKYKQKNFNKDDICTKRKYNYLYNKAIHHYLKALHYTQNEETPKINASKGIELTIMLKETIYSTSK